MKTLKLLTLIISFYFVSYANASSVYCNTINYCHRTCDNGNIDLGSRNYYGWPGLPPMPASRCPEDRAPSVSRLSCKVTGNYYPGEHTGPGAGSGTIGGKYYHCQFNCKDGPKSPWLHWSYPAPAKYSDFCIDAPKVVAPNISNSTPKNLVTNLGSTISWHPNNTGGSVTHYSISPSLPSGLSFNTSNGTISGIPTVANTTNYTITAYNAGGSSKVVINITTKKPVKPLKTLTSGVPESDSLARREWHFYKISVAKNAKVTVELTNLTADLDLYANKGQKPTISSFECRPYNRGTSLETCTFEFDRPGVAYISVYAHHPGSYKITATIEKDIIQQLTLNQEKNDFVTKGQWKYYKLDATTNAKVIFRLLSLSGDVDLYIKQNAKPEINDYDCRPYIDYKKFESCVAAIHGTMYIGIYGYVSGNYKLLAKESPPKAVLLLHGLNSDASTWNALKIKEFNDKCTTLPLSGSIENANNRGVSCFALNFGGYDRYGLKGLDNISCDVDIGCQGDYSSFSQLGQEVNNAITTIKQYLGNHTEIVLLGHSRGGLAARSFMQGGYENKNSVLSMITTGTPHKGTPFGRIYDYLQQNCLPESTHKNDNGDCEDDWEAVYVIDSDLDIRVPSIGLLSEGSTDITTLKNNINNLNDYNKTHVQLIYHNKTFGDVSPFYNPLPSQGWFLDQLSDRAERFILNGQSFDPLKGDGIVPSSNQMFNGIGRDVNSYDYSGIRHAKETGQTEDLTKALHEIYNKLGW